MACLLHDENTDDIHVFIFYTERLISNLFLPFILNIYKYWIYIPWRGRTTGDLLFYKMVAIVKYGEQKTQKAKQCNSTRFTAIFLLTWAWRFCQKFSYELIPLLWVKSFLYLLYSSVEYSQHQVFFTFLYYFPCAFQKFHEHKSRWRYIKSRQNSHLFSKKKIIILSTLSLKIKRDKSLSHLKRKNCSYFT